MYEYCIEKVPEDKISIREKWFEEMHNEGWELVCLDYPRTNTNGSVISYLQKYIFRRKKNNLSNNELL